MKFGQCIFLCPIGPLEEPMENTKRLDIDTVDYSFTLDICYIMTCGGDYISEIGLFVNSFCPLFNSKCKFILSGVFIIKMSKVV